MLVVLFLWIIWRVVKIVIPKFIRKMIGWEWSPWRELKSAGIFRLIDTIVEVIFSTKTVESRFKDVGAAVGDFLASGTELLGKEAYDALKIKQLTSRKNGSPAPAPAPVDDAKDPSPITDEEQARINEIYSRCVEGNILIEDPGMSKMDLMKIKASNQSILIQCKLDQVKQNMDIIAMRARP